MISGFNVANPSRYQVSSVSSGYIKSHLSLKAPKRNMFSKTVLCSFLSQAQLPLAQAQDDLSSQETCFSPNSVSTLWGSYGSGKGLVLFEVSFCCSSFRLRRLAQSSCVMAVCGRSPVAGFWVVLSGVCTLFEAKRGFT